MGFFLTSSEYIDVAAKTSIHILHILSRILCGIAFEPFYLVNKVIYTGQNKLGIKLLRMHFGSIDN